nr:hypothetical protein [Tanacetum cinerariifolium]
MIASSESRNSSKNMPRFSSNDMVYNHYLDEARKKTQERDRNSKLNEKLNKENEHLKQTYKDLSDSIKKTSVQTKDHADSLIVQLNCYSISEDPKEEPIEEEPLEELKEESNMDSSMGKMCLGQDINEISSDRNEGSEIRIHLNTKIQQEMKERKNLKLWSFTKCTLRRIVIGIDVSLREEIYFVQFIINPEEDEFEPGLIFERSFLRSAKAITNFREGTITIQPDFDPFLLSSYEEGNPNLNDLEMLLDFDFDEIPQIETDLPPMVCKIGKGSQNKKKIMKNIMYFNNGAGPSSSVGIPLTQEEAEKRRKINGKSERHMIKEKKDPGAFIFPIRLEDLINENPLADTGADINTMPYRIYEQLGRDDIMKEDRNIIMINYTEAEVTGWLVNVLCQVRFTTLSAKFLIMEIPTSGAYDHEAGSSRTKHSRYVETVKEALLPNVPHEFLEWSGCSREAKSRYNTRLTSLLLKLIYSSHIVDWQLLHKIGCGEEIDHMLKISLKEAQSNKEIFFSVAWVRAFNIREPIHPELYREFYATYEFDEVCADDELQSKKTISFRLRGRAHSLTLLEFARRLGLYHAEELDEEGFDTYFQGVLHKMITYRLCQRTTGYEKIQKNDLWLLSRFEARHQNGYANMAWVIAKWIKRKGARSQKDSQICCGHFISKIARKSKVLTEEIVRTLSTLVYCRNLDRTTLRELINSEARLIPDILLDDVLRVSIQRAPRVQRALMQDLYERMGSMEIRHEAIKRMGYRQAYHWDRYQGIFKHMVGAYNVPLQGDYNSPS